MSARIPLAVPDLRGREEEYLSRCVRENWISSAGPEVGAFEARLAALCGRAQAVATVNGTAALHVALVGAGVGPGDMVAIPDWTFAGTANAVAYAGATPLLIDITRESWTMDPALLAAALETHAGRVKAVMPVHALGHPADMDAIRAACGQAGVRIVIEDAAGAIGAAYGGRPAGSLADAGVFSFNGNKTVTAGGGGALVTDDAALADAARVIVGQGRSGRAYTHDRIGFNFRMTNVSAAIGLAQLERMDEMVAAKRAIARRYDDAIAARDDLVPMPRAAWAESSCWLYSCLVGSQRDAAALVAHLAERAIEARPFWLPLSGQAPFAAAPKALAGVAAEIGGRVVSLPCSSALSEADQARVIEALAAWRGSRRAAAA